MTSLSDWTRADAISALSFLVALFALFVAWHAVRRSNQNSSAATFVTLSEAFREAWQRFFDARSKQPETDSPEAIDQAVQYQFSDLMNLLELACALHHEKSLVGVSRELAEEYLASVLQIIGKDPSILRMMQAALTTPTTGKYIQVFLKYLKNTGKDKKYRIENVAARTD